jgi:predicted nucleic acid-binding protein
VNHPRAVVDSSGWIEVFTNGPLADLFLAVIEAEANLVVPSISILATTRAHQARLYTLDADFKDLHDVELMQRP